MVTLYRVALCWICATTALAERVPAGRYVRLDAAITAPGTAPLTVLRDISFPTAARTVADAVHILLVDSGYRLSPTANTHQEYLLALPLPGAHRALGMVSRRDALVRLGEPAYRLLIDPLHRLIGYDAHPLYCGAP